MQTPGDDVPPVGQDLLLGSEPTAAPAPSLNTLFFELSLAAALPSESVMAPAADRRRSSASTAVANVG